MSACWPRRRRRLPCGYRFPKARVLPLALRRLSLRSLSSASGRFSFTTFARGYWRACLDTNREHRRFPLAATLERAFSEQQASLRLRMFARRGPAQAWGLQSEPLQLTLQILVG